jgi:hypothetical protein
MDDGNGLTGHLVSWGYYDYPPAGCESTSYTTANCNNDHPIAEPFVSIAAGHHFDLARRPDGTIKYYGNGNIDGIGNFPGGSTSSGSISQFSEMFTARNHATARLPGTGALTAWDAPSVYGPLPEPPANSSQVWGVTSGGNNGHVLGLIGCFANCDNSTAQHRPF